MDDINSVLKKITETISQSALYHLDALEIYLDDNDSYAQFLTTQNVKKLENMNVLLSESMFFSDWEKEHVPYFLKAKYEDLEGKYDERVLGFFYTWIQDDYNMFVAKLFCEDVKPVFYKWYHDVSLAEKIEMKEEDVFGVVDWCEVIYPQ